MKKQLLTLYVFPGDDWELDDFDRLESSIVNKDVVEIIRLDSRDQIDETLDPETKWWGFLFGNEYLQESLSKALPTHLKFNAVDCLTLFKSVVKSDKKRVTEFAARIFRSTSVPVGIERWKHIGGLKFDKVLDGFLLEADRK